MYKNTYWTDLAQVKRQSYIGSKSTYSLTWNTYKGALKINSTVEIWEQENNKLWVDYWFFTKVTADIEETDVLVIDNEEYTVKETWKKSWKIVKFTKMKLVKIPPKTI